MQKNKDKPKFTYTKGGQKYEIDLSNPKQKAFLDKLVGDSEERKINYGEQYCEY